MPIRSGALSEETEFFLETAIRMGPKQRYADAAFALLEEFLVSGHTGSSGTYVPPDVVKRPGNSTS